MEWKRIRTGGIGYLEPLEGSTGWYWGMDYTNGDLYEAEELYTDRHRINSNRLIFVSYPGGELHEPVRAEAGQYFGRPAFRDSRTLILLADFPAGEIRILAWDGTESVPEVHAVVPRSEITDCYNLLLHTEPLMLTRQGHENRFDILWPEKASFPINGHETFLFRDGEELFFSCWYEDPDYREETVVRHYPDGGIVRTVRGSLLELPDGQKWLLADAGEEDDSGENDR